MAARRHSKSLARPEREIWLKSLVNLGRRLSGGAKAAQPAPAGARR